MFAFRHGLKPAALFLVLLLALPSCREKSASDNGRKTPSDRLATEYEFKRLQAELKLADSSRTYLVMDLDKGKLQLKLKAALVWEYPIQLADGDSVSLYRFADRYLGDDARTIRFVTEKYLYDAQGKSPDSVLALVSKVLEVEPELLQRHIPGRFTLKWDRRLILDVDTDIEGIPTSRLKNTVQGVSDVLGQPFEVHLDLKMHPDAAITFWHAVQEGMPTLLVPPK